MLFIVLSRLGKRIFFNPDFSPVLYVLHIRMYNTCTLSLGVDASASKRITRNLYAVCYIIRVGEGGIAVVFFFSRVVISYTHCRAL